jgi:hypothetical protein
LIARLEAVPGVSAVTFSSFVPGFAGGRRIQFEDPSTAHGAERQTGQDLESQAVSTLEVAIGMFDIDEAEILAGRTFTASDLGAAHMVVVNRSFVERFLQPEPDRGRQSRGALGLRFRYAPVPGQQPGIDAPRGWYQIVGVVRDFPIFRLR